MSVFSSNKLLLLLVSILSKARFKCYSSHTYVHSVLLYSFDTYDEESNWIEFQNAAVLCGVGAGSSSSWTGGIFPFFAIIQNNLINGIILLNYLYGIQVISHHK